MNEADLESFACDALKRIGETKLLNAFTIGWNTRLRSTAGRITLPHLSIEINPRLLTISEDEVKRTVLHELAHLLAWKRGQHRGHGAPWRQACADLGIPDETVTHSLPLPIHRKRKNWLYTCPNCGKSHERVRKSKRKMACASCCKQFNRNRYTTRFAFVITPISASEEN